MESSNYMLSEILGVTHGFKKFYVFHLLPNFAPLINNTSFLPIRNLILKKCSLHSLSLRFFWDAADTVNKSIEFYEILIVTNF